MKTCKKCGGALEVSHIVMGKLRTHPCCCRCEIEKFEKQTKRWKKRTAVRHAEE